VLAKGDNERFFLYRQHRGLRLARTGAKIGDSTTPIPFGDSLLIDSEAPCEASQVYLTM
jgi:hypothetical protein